MAAGAAGTGGTQRAVTFLLPPLSTSEPSEHIGSLYFKPPSSTTANVIKQPHQQRQQQKQIPAPFRDDPASSSTPALAVSTVARHLSRDVRRPIESARRATTSGFGSAGPFGRRPVSVPNFIAPVSAVACRRVCRSSKLLTARMATAQQQPGDTNPSQPAIAVEPVRSHRRQSSGPRQQQQQQQNSQSRPQNPGQRMVYKDCPRTIVEDSVWLDCASKMEIRLCLTPRMQRAASRCGSSRIAKCEDEEGSVDDESRRESGEPSATPSVADR